jgi:hypothetical protein
MRPYDFERDAPSPRARGSRRRRASGGQAPLKAFSSSAFVEAAPNPAPKLHPPEGPEVGGDPRDLQAYLTPDDALLSWAGRVIEQLPEKRDRIRVLRGARRRVFDAFTDLSITLKPFEAITRKNKRRIDHDARHGLQSHLFTFVERMSIVNLTRGGVQKSSPERSFLPRLSRGSLITHGSEALTNERATLRSIRGHRTPSAPDGRNRRDVFQPPHHVQVQASG